MVSDAILSKMAGLLFPPGQTTTVPRSDFYILGTRVRIRDQGQDFTHEKFGRDRLSVKSTLTFCAHHILFKALTHLHQPGASKLRALVG